MAKVRTPVLKTHIDKISGIERDLQRSAAALAAGGVSDAYKGKLTASIGRRVSALQKELSYADSVGTKIDPEMRSRLEKYSSDFEGALKDAQTREAENKKIVAAQNARTAVPSNFSGGTVNKQGTTGKSFTDPATFQNRKAQQAQDRAAYVQQRSGVSGPQTPSSARIRPSIIDKMAPVLREAQKEDTVRERLIAERGIDPEKASLTQQQLLDEAVNTEVYGTSRPNFKTGPNVLTVSQKAQEKSLSASAPQEDIGAILKESPPVVKSVVTSDPAREFTQEQFELLDGFQQRASATASETISGLIETDPDILAAQNAGEDATALLQEKEAFYADVYNRTLEEIKQAYDSKEEGFKEAARIEMGQNTALLARMGALGTTTAGVQYLGDIERDNQAKLLTFAAEEAAAIQKAYEAYQEADFELAQEMIDVAEGTRKEIRDIRSSALDQKIKVKQLQQLEVEDATRTLDNIVKSGMAEEDLPPGYLEYLDEKGGLPYGTSSGLMKMAEQEKQIAALEAEEERRTKTIENANKMVTLMKDLPPGATFVVDGVEYTSLNPGETTTGTETDENGNVTLWAYNKDTGAYETRSLGNIGKSQGWDWTTDNNGNIVAINPMTQEMKVVYSANTPGGLGMTTGGLIDLFPNNSYSPFTDENGRPRTQCGAWVNDLTGIGVGDSFQSKMALMDTTIGGPDNPPMPGDVFTTREGGWTGHTGVVNNVTPLPDGDFMLTLSESNFKKDGKGVGLITHDRQIRASQCAGFARTDFKNPAYAFGTDTQGGLDFRPKDALEAEKAANADVSQYGRAKDDKYLSAAGKLYDDFNANQTVKDFVIQQTGYQTALDIPNETASPQDDITLIFSFMKVLDPGSVVREGEFATASKYTDLLDGIGVKWNRVKKGQLLSPKQRQGIKDAMERKYGIATSSYENVLNTFTNRAESFKIDPSDVIVDYRESFSAPATSAEDLKSQYPEYAEKIQQKLDEGYSIEEISDALSGS